MCQITRRGFMVGCSTAIASLAGSRFNTLAFAQSGSADEILVVLFLRGGMDGLNFMPPIAGSDRGYYETARPQLQVPISGSGAAIPLNAQFGINPAAAPLFDLYTNGSLALVQATGHNIANRSHFDAMEFMELGTPGLKNTPTGWLTRHLQTSSTIPQDVIMPSLSMGDIQQAALRGDRETINLGNLGSFNLHTGPWRWRPNQRASLRRLYGFDSTVVHVAGTKSLDAVDVIELYVNGAAYTPANGASYPTSNFGDHLQSIAQMIKLDIGLHVATLDLGGWDTHQNQDYWLPVLLDELARGLMAFYTDLDGGSGGNNTDRLTVVVMSEFGRRFGENADDGTDHGYANTMMVMGGNVIGGLHGTWPGLAPGALFDGVDLAVTTDYRRILSEILIRRLGNNRIGTIFPGYTGYSPLGVVSGPDMPPDYGDGGAGDNIFIDGFESGNTAAWG